MSHARRSLRLVEEDLRLEHAQLLEQLQEVRTELVELRQLAGLCDLDQPLQ